MANQVAYGFHNLQNVFDRRVSTVGVATIATAIQQSVDEHNRQMNALIALFAQRTTDFQIQYRTPALARLQPSDEQGRARPIRPGGQYTVAFPLQRGLAAWGSTYEANVKMTVEEANEATNTLLMADARWMRDHILAALFDNAGFTFTDDEHGALAVKGLANSDSVTYQILAGADSQATDTHYLAQANAIGDADNPFDNIYAELMEHPDNGGEVVALIPTNLRAATEALTLFNEIEDPALRPSANRDVLIGTLGVETPGVLFGRVNQVWCVEWRSAPSSYILALCTEGERALAMREHPEAELQGFKKDADRNDYPYLEGQWARRAGFGAKNRVGALVYRVGNGSYAVPTGYTTPLA